MNKAKSCGLTARSPLCFNKHDQEAEYGGGIRPLMSKHRTPRGSDIVAGGSIIAAVRITEKGKNSC